MNAFIACGHAKLLLGNQCSIDCFSNQRYKCHSVKDTIDPADSSTVILLSCVGLSLSDNVLQSVEKSFCGKGIAIPCYLFRSSSDIANVLAG